MSAKPPPLLDLTHLQKGLLDRVDEHGNRVLKTPDEQRVYYKTLMNEGVIPHLRKLRPRMAAVQRLETYDEWIKAAKAWVLLINNPYQNLLATMESVNRWWAEVVEDPVIAEELQEQVEKVEQRRETRGLLADYASFTYLLAMTGRLIVLVDNVEKAAVWPGREAVHSPHLYTLMSQGDATNDAANIEYYVTTGRDEDRRVNIHQEWLKCQERQKLHGITFDPSTTDRIVNGQFNIWRGWRWEPVKSTADEPFWVLVRDVICNGNVEYYGFVRKWLAHMVQKPGERPLCALGISGPQGAGKSTFVKVIGGLMHASHYNPNVPMGAVAGREQGRDLEGLLLAYLDEASWGGDRLSVGALKKAITGETELINEKFVPKYSMPTYKRLIFTSNDPYYYHADPDDRRLLPLEVKAEKAPSPEFFQRIFDGQAYRPEVQQALLYTLLHEDIAGWVPQNALRTLTITTGGAMLERSMSNVQKWLFESIRNRAFEVPVWNQERRTYAVEEVTGGVISIHELKESYRLHAEHDSFDRNRQVNLSSSENNDLLRRVFGEKQKAIPTEKMRQLRAAIAGLPACDRKSFEIDWERMQANFSALFKWKLAWDDGNVIDLKTRRAYDTGDDDLDDLIAHFSGDAP